MRAAAVAANAAVCLSVVLLPWYGLDDYVASGWDATVWARAALILALVNLMAIRARGATGSRTLALAVLALIAFRVALPPDFGFDFDGLDVPVERRPGAWVALGAALTAAALAGLPARESGRASPSRSASEPAPR